MGSVGGHASDGELRVTGIGDGEEVGHGFHTDERGAEVGGAADRQDGAERVERVGHRRRDVEVRVTGLVGDEDHFAVAVKGQIRLIRQTCRTAGNGEAHGKRARGSGGEAESIRPELVANRGEVDGLVRFGHGDGGDGAGDEVQIVGGLGRFNHDRAGARGREQVGEVYDLPHPAVDRVGHDARAGTTGGREALRRTEHLRTRRREDERRLRGLVDGEAIGHGGCGQPVGVAGLRGADDHFAGSGEGQIGLTRQFRRTADHVKAHRQPGGRGGRKHHEVGRELIGDGREVDRLFGFVDHEGYHKGLWRVGGFGGGDGVGGVVGAGVKVGCGDGRGEFDGGLLRQQAGGRSDGEPVHGAGAVGDRVGPGDAAGARVGEDEGLGGRIGANEGRAEVERVGAECDVAAVTEAGDVDRVRRVRAVEGEDERGGVGFAGLRVENNRNVNRRGRRDHRGSEIQREGGSVGSVGGHASDGELRVTGIGDGEEVGHGFHTDERGAEVGGAADRQDGAERVERVGHRRRDVEVRVTGLVGDEDHFAVAVKGQIRLIRQTCRTAGNGEAHGKRARGSGGEAESIRPELVADRGEVNGLISLLNDQCSRGFALIHDIVNRSGHGVTAGVDGRGSAAVVGNVHGQADGHSFNGHFTRRAVVGLGEIGERHRGDRLGDFERVGHTRGGVPVGVTGL